MGCEERHEPRERLPALLALLPSLLLPLGICSRGGGLGFGQEQHWGGHRAKRREEAAHRGRKIGSQNCYDTPFLKKP
jgi:hypothetical protein